MTSSTRSPGENFNWTQGCGRLLRMLSEAGALAPSESGRFNVAVGADEPLLDGALMDPDSLADSLARLYPPRRQRTGVTAPLRGVVHLMGLGGSGAQARTEDMADDVKHAGASALALGQGMLDAGATPTHGVWFVALGVQVLDQDLATGPAGKRLGQLSGSPLWGIGKVVAGSRLAARLVRSAAERNRLALPDEPAWRLAPDSEGSLDGLQAEPTPASHLEPGEVRVAVEAAGLNFRNVLLAMGLLDTGLLGRELCSRVVETAADVTRGSVGDRAMGLSFGTVGPEVTVHEGLLAPAPPGMSMMELATVPSAFVTAAISFELAKLQAGDSVLVHAGAGGVGIAAIQLAQASGAEVFAMASAPKQAYLRSRGVGHAFDSRQTNFGEEILQATNGAGVQVLPNIAH